MDFRPAIRFFSCSSRRRLALEFLLYAVLAAVMLHLTWLTWPDAFIDFSRELYLPWRVACGDVLYRDLAYDFGPLSVYANAALFALLGRPSIHALFALNFAFWIATLLALRAILRRIANQVVASTAIAGFILLFSFNRYNFTGNYNFLAPYSHEITRGFLFALLTLLSLDSALRNQLSVPSPSRFPCRFLLPGLFSVLVLFTKPEIALAVFTSIAFLFTFQAWNTRSSPLRPLLVFSCAVFAATVLVVTPFAIALHSFSQAFRCTLLNLYLGCFNGGLSSVSLYRTILGIDHPLLNAFRIFLGAFFASLPFLLARFASSRHRSLPSRISGEILLVLLASSIGWFAYHILAAAIPLAPAALLVLSLRQRWAQRYHLEGTNTSSVPSNSASFRPLFPAFALFSLVLTAKIVLNMGIDHYGFVLALPSFCCAVIFAFRPACPPSRALLAAILLLAFSAAALATQRASFRRWNIRLPVYDSAFLAPDFQAKAFNAALAWLRANTPHDSTLAVLPEGSLLNLQSRRPNSTPFIYLSHGDLLRFSDAAVLAAYSNSPPDTLVLVTKLGEPRFGIDYARDLMDFLNPLYTPVVTIPLSTPAGTIPYLVIARKTDSLPPPDHQEIPPP